MTRQLGLNLFIALYLVLQLALPWNGLLRSPLDTRGSFSWNMFSRQSHCEGWFDQELPTGDRVPLPIDHFLNVPTKYPDLFDRGRLMRFNAWLCRTHGPRVEAMLRCSVDDGPEIDLLSPEVDLCSAPSYGVLGR